MEILPREENERILGLLSRDEKERDRARFCYAFDVLKRNWVCPFSIWPLPNEDARRVITGQAIYDELPFENLNEVEKGLFWREQRRFVGDNTSAGREMLCEAMNNQPCTRESCPLFRSEKGICSKYKLVFRKES